MSPPHRLLLNRLRYENSRKLFDDLVVRETFPCWMAYQPGDYLSLDREYNMELKLIVRILDLLAEEFQIRKPRQHADLVVVRNFQQAEAG